MRFALVGAFLSYGILCTAVVSSNLSNSTKVLPSNATASSNRTSSANSTATPPPEPVPGPYDPISYVCHDNGFTIQTRRNHSEGNRRYRNGETTVICEGKPFTLDCGRGNTIRVIDAEYGRFDTTTCHSYPHFFMRCEANDAYNKVHQRCDNKQRCSINSTATEFGDPCPGIVKYLRVKHRCEPVSPAENLLTKTICEEDKGFIGCPEGRTIMVSDVFYGRKDANVCPVKVTANVTSTTASNVTASNVTTPVSPISNIPTNTCQSSLALDIVSARCDHERNCTIAPSNVTFDDPCNGTSKYLQVDYQCVQDDLKYVVACQDSKLVIECTNMSYINVVRAEYGRSHPFICNNNNQRIEAEGCSSPNELAIMFGMCQGKSICEVPANSKIFGEPCPGKPKYLEVDYFCSDLYEDSDSGGPPQVRTLKTDRVTFYSNKLNVNNSKLYIAQIKEMKGNTWHTVMDGEEEKFDFSQPHTVGGLDPDGYYDARIIKKKGIVSSCLPFTRIRARKPKLI